VDNPNRRQHVRIARPFNGRRQGPIPLPIHIHDLSAGGCLIQSFHEVEPGRRMTLEIELPDEGWITVEAESLYMREDYGYAVAFVNVPDDTREKLERALTRLAREAGV
jgi:PilZ domain